MFADSADGGQHFAEVVRPKCGVPRLPATAMWGRDEAETLARLEAWNGAIRRVRVEEIFGTWERCDGEASPSHLLRSYFIATAYTLKRSLNLQSA